ncbi:unnamed protein product, partial [Gongylonema pulchrum]|uniref:DUF302 domain-containing protein n=1 Tax=Gongylonema pulchrum TaxID=637853 RepID=A0A183DBG8_9BILA
MVTSIFTHSNHFDVILTISVRWYLQVQLEKAILDYIKDGLHELPDVRIHIVSDRKISVFCHTRDHSGAIDVFLVHPIGMAGDYYAFSLPMPTFEDGTSSIYLMPLGATNKTRLLKGDIHNVSLTIRRSYAEGNTSEMQQTMKVCKLLIKTEFAY